MDRVVLKLNWTKYLVLFLLFWISNFFMSRFHFIYHHLMLDSCIKVSMQLKKTKLYTILLLFVPPFNSTYHFRTLLIMIALSREQINVIKNSSRKISDKTQKTSIKQKTTCCDHIMSFVERVIVCQFCCFSLSRCARVHFRITYVHFVNIVGALSGCMNNEIMYRAWGEVKSHKKNLHGLKSNYECCVRPPVIS